MAENKFEAELNRLIKKRGLIIALLHVMDMEINIKHELEHIDAIQFPYRSSVQSAQIREKWQQDLAATKEDISGMLKILDKQTRNEFLAKIAAMEAELTNLRNKLADSVVQSNNPNE